MTLETATAAARTGDWTACLIALIDAWRPQREPELAELITRVNARAPMRPLGATNRDLIARIADATVAELGPLTEALARSVVTRPAMVDHVLALARSHARDPRIAQLLAAVAGRSIYSGVRGHPDQQVLEALDAIDDPRWRALIVQTAAREEQQRSFMHPDLVKYLDHLVEVSGRAAQRPSPASVDPAVVRAIDNELAGDRSGHDGDLLAAIYAEPASTSARLVYADQLQERGEPRGEFIALQCAGGSSKRERVLLKLHERAWLGPLDRFIHEKGLVYRRGFPAAGRLVTPSFERLPETPAWHTFEELDLGSTREESKFLLGLPHLQRIANLSPSDLPLVRGATWRSLGVRHVGKGYLDALAMPNLVELDLSTAELLPFVTTALATCTQPFERLRVKAHARSLHLDELARLRDRARELEVVRSFEFIQTSNSVVITGTHASVIQRKPKLDDVLALLIALPVGIITTVTLPSLPDELAQRGVTLA